MPSTFDVPGLTGAHKVDQPMIRRYIAEQTGISGRAVGRWMSLNEVSMHHFQGNQIQLVPNRIHDLHHTGSASVLRDGG